MHRPALRGVLRDVGACRERAGCFAQVVDFFVFSIRVGAPYNGTVRLSCII
jgi:hypothetical protein